MKEPMRQQEVRQKICFPRQHHCCRGIGEKGRKKTCLQSWCQWWKCLWRKIRRFQVRSVLSILGTLLWSSLKYRKNTSIDEGILKQTMFFFQRVPKRSEALNSTACSCSNSTWQDHCQIPVLEGLQTMEIHFHLCTRAPHFLDTKHMSKVEI